MSAVRYARGNTFNHLMHVLNGRDLSKFEQLPKQMLHTTTLFRRSRLLSCLFLDCCQLLTFEYSKAGNGEFDIFAVEHTFSILGDSLAVT